MVTLKDIAQAAGVSTMTVSRVVNNVPSRVSDDTRKRIWHLVDEMGYVPNSSARSLSGNASHLIAIVIGGEGNLLKYPYNALMTGSISHFFQQKGYSALIYQAQDYREVTRQLRSWRVDGAVFLGLFDSDMKNIRKDNRIPLVFTDSYSPIRQLSNVGIDDYKGGELAAQHLIDNGHRRMAFIGGSVDESPVVRNRLRGFRHTLSKAGLELPDENIFLDDVDSRLLRALFARDDAPTAFFATADITALQLIHALREIGLSVPRDCSVIGFDNLDVSALSMPPLTTIAQDVDRKAQLAAELLIHTIEDSETPTQNIILDVHLIKRSSVRNLAEIS